jgi:hypothetical protein
MTLDTVEGDDDEQSQSSLPPELLLPRLRRRAASEYLLLAHGLRVSKSTLDKLAGTQNGPVFQKLHGSTPYYARADLDAWAVQSLGPCLRSTSEAPEHSREAQPIYQKAVFQYTVRFAEVRTYELKVTAKDEAAAKQYALGLWKDAQEVGGVDRWEIGEAKAELSCVTKATAVGGAKA